VAQSGATEPTRVKIDSGAVRAAVVGDVLNFKGIPYAQPPVGVPRWQILRPVTRWQEVLKVYLFRHQNL
jgi:para-nitrobenzyl esterase